MGRETMAGLVQRILRDIIKSGKDGIVRSSPDISVLWAGSRDGRPVSTYGIFIGSDCICFGHKNEVKPYEIHIPPREKVKQYAPMVADILRAAGMLVEILENEIIVIDGMEIPWDGEKMTMYSGKVNIFIH